jgi:hypothetical protein
MVPRYQWWGSFARETRGEHTRESCAPLVFYSQLSISRKSVRNSASHVPGNGATQSYSHLPPHFFLAQRKQRRAPTDIRVKARASLEAGEN